LRDINPMTGMHLSAPRPDPPAVDWDDPDAVWVYKRTLFDSMEIEVAAGKPTVPYRPHVGQMPVHFPEEGEEWEVFVAAAGQRAGKSLTAAAEIVARLGMPGQRMWIVAPNYDLAQRVFEMVHDFVVRQQVHGRGSVKKASNSKDNRSIRMNWGSWVRTKSAENADSLVGEKLTFLVLDEAAQVAEEIWTGFLEPRLVNLKGKALLISSPRGRNWFWKYHRRGTEEMTRVRGWRCGHFSTADNPYVDKQFLESKRAILPKLVYEQEYEGKFVSKQGLVYEDYKDELLEDGGHLFDPETHPVQADWTHYAAVDVGIRHKTAALEMSVDPEGNYWVHGEYLKGGSNHQNHARAIASQLRYKTTQGWISPDAGRTNQLTPDTAISANDVYAEAGLYFYPANNAVQDGISLVQKFLCASLAAKNATTHPRLYISKELLNLRKGFLSYMWAGRRGRQHEDVKTDLPEKPRKYEDDIMDALRYLVAGRPRYEKPLHYSEVEGYDPQGFEGTRVGRPGSVYVRPGVDYG